MAAPIIYNPAYLFAHEAGDQYSARSRVDFQPLGCGRVRFCQDHCGPAGGRAQMTRQGVKDVMAAGFQYSGVFGPVR